MGQYYKLIAQTGDDVQVYDGLHFMVAAAQVYNHVKSLGVSVKDSLVKVVC